MDAERRRSYHHGVGTAVTVPAAAGDTVTPVFAVGGPDQLRRCFSCFSRQLRTLHALCRRCAFPLWRQIEDAIEQEKLSLHMVRTPFEGGVVHHGPGTPLAVVLDP